MKLIQKIKAKFIVVITGIIVFAGLFLLSGIEGPDGNIQWGAAISGIICLIIGLVMSHTIYFDDIRE